MVKTTVTSDNVNNEVGGCCTTAPTTSTGITITLPLDGEMSGDDSATKPTNRRLRSSCPTMTSISTRMRGSRFSLFVKAQAAKIIPLNSDSTTTTTMSHGRFKSCWKFCLRNKFKLNSNKADAAKKSSGAQPTPIVSVINATPEPVESSVEANERRKNRCESVEIDKVRIMNSKSKTTGSLNCAPIVTDSTTPKSDVVFSSLKAKKSTKRLKTLSMLADDTQSSPTIDINNSVSQFTNQNDTDRPSMNYLQISDHFGHMPLLEQLSDSSQLSLGASAVTPTLESSAGALSWLSRESQTSDCSFINNYNNSYNKENSDANALSANGHRAYANWKGARSYANSECSLATTVSQVRPETISALAAKTNNRAPQSFGELLRSALLQVSVDTMAITALPLDCWLKERLKNWVQLSGHAGTIVPASNHTLWKKLPNQNITEATAYAKITADPALTGLTPKFYKEIMHKNESFIEIQDLLAQFPNTSSRAIMDIKIGVRTFMESEVANTTKRTDLYKKMVDIAPDEPTEQERADEAITKLRYMQFRERESSTASLGFRIEAAQLPGGKLQKNFKKVQTKMQVMETLVHFFGERYVEICAQLAARLRVMRDGIEKSEFFRTHEVVGSSILVVYDDTKTGAWMIDFAKSTTVPDSIKLNHCTPWKIGNHEDGYLIGLTNLIDIVETAEKQSKRISTPSVLTSVNK